MEGGEEGGVRETERKRERGKRAGVGEGRRECSKKEEEGKRGGGAAEA